MSPAFNVLSERAALFKKVRTFFEERDVIEVDCPILTEKASVDLHIDLFKCDERYLFSSPEYGMKRLLANGAPDIYQMGHVFRKGEVGPLHNPEFTMIEWYRLGFSFDAFIDETLALMRLFLGDLPSERLSYREAFQTYASIDPFTDSDDAIYAAAKNPPAGPLTREELLHFILSFQIEPHLGQEKLTVLSDYPPSEAALAQTTLKNDILVAERFEIYHQGVELCNGYNELTDAREQRRRFEETNAKRKEPLPIDEAFLAALEKGLPPCCGVAVGFDRLMLLRLEKSSLSDVLPFSWELA